METWRHGVRVLDSPRFLLSRTPPLPFPHSILAFVFAVVVCGVVVAFHRARFDQLLCLR